MTMQLTLTLPASIDELRLYVAACGHLSLDRVALGYGDSDAELLVAKVGQSGVPELEQIITPPAPAKKPPAKVAKRATKKQAASTSPASAGTVALAVLTALVDADGMFDGSYASLAKAAYPSNPASAATELRKMESATWIAAERINSRVQRVAITTKGREVYARLTDGPKPEAPADNVRPITPPAPAPAPTVPAAGLQAPAKGWA